jgi:signal transduction histidine kinase
MIHLGGRAVLLLLAGLFVLPQIHAAWPAGETSSHRVLIIYENDSTQTAVTEIGRGLHLGLDAPNPTEFEIYSEYLDNARFPEPDNLTRTASHLAAKYKGIELDAVVTIGPAALQFLLDNRDAIAPRAPVLFAAVSAKTASSLPPDVKGVVSQYDLRQTLALARQLQPGSAQVLVLSGSGEFDKQWQQSAVAALGSRYLGFKIDYLSGLTLDGFKNALARLPTDTVVLMLTIFEDADGRKFLPLNAVAKIAPSSSAPVYSVYDTYFGKGILGGYMGTFQDTGQQLAGLIKRTIDGDGNIPQTTPSIARPIVDWRQIARFGLDAALLPPDTEIRFRTPSLWDEHRVTILLTIAVVLAQAAMITALIIQARRRKTAESELATGRLELAHLSRATLLGELSGAFAHELNQPLTSILANAQVGKELLSNGGATPSELDDILTDIVVDNKRAAEMISQLRRLFTKGEAALEAVELNGVASEALALIKSELLARRSVADFKRGQDPIMVSGNFAQLQQVLLNLIINAADATSHLQPSARRIEVAVRKNAQRGELVVTDNGRGLDKEMMAEVFKPFVSTKAKGLGIGLSICRSIVRAHGGTLGFDEDYAGGARIVLSLPLKRHDS